MCHAEGSGPAGPPRFIVPSMTAWWWWWWWRMGDSGASRTSPPAWALWFSCSERNSPWASTYCDGSAISEHELPHTHVHAYITTVFSLHSGHQFICLQPRINFLSLAEQQFFLVLYKLVELDAEIHLAFLDCTTWVSFWENFPSYRARDRDRFMTTVFVLICEVLLRLVVNIKCEWEVLLKQNWKNILETSYFMLKMRLEGTTFILYRSSRIGL